MDKQKTKKIVKIVINVFVWLFVAFAVLMTAMALAAQANSDGVPAIGGKCLLTVSSDSMKPQFKKGDLIFGTMLSDQEKLELKAKSDDYEGDVISFYADLNGDGTKEINTHRIIGVNVDANGNVTSYVTLGDNNNGLKDPKPVKTSEVICKWEGGKIAGLGGFISFLQKPTGFLVVIVLPLVLLFLYQAYVFVRTVIAVKNDGKRQITAADEELIKQKAIEEYLRQQAAANNSDSTESDATPENND